MSKKVWFEATIMDEETRVAGEFDDDATEAEVEAAFIEWMGYQRCIDPSTARWSWA